VSAALGGVGPPATVDAEETPVKVSESKQVLDPECPTRTRIAEATRYRTESMRLVIFLARGGVPEHIVRGRDLLEAVLGPWVCVGVVLLGQLPVRARDVLVGGRRRDAEHLVV